MDAAAAYRHVDLYRLCRVVDRGSHARGCRGRSGEHAEGAVCDRDAMEVGDYTSEDGRSARG